MNMLKDFIKPIFSLIFEHKKNRIKNHMMNIFDSKIIIYSILCELDITLKKNQHDCLTNDI